MDSRAVRDSRARSLTEGGGLGPILSTDTQKTVAELVAFDYRILPDGDWP